VFVTRLFALFTRFGGANSAYVAVAGGMAVRAALGAATAGSIGVALIEERRK